MGDWATLLKIKMIDVGKLTGLWDPRVMQAGKELAVAEVKQEKTGKEADETKEMRDQFEHDKEREEVDRVFGEGKGSPKQRGVT